MPVRLVLGVPAMAAGNTTGKATNCADRTSEVVLRDPRARSAAAHLARAILLAATAVVGACSSGSSGGNVQTNGALGDAGELDAVDAAPLHCGDPGAPLCAPGEECRDNADCDSLICTDGICAAPSATDGVKNGDETDVDCGGASAPKCAVGQSCIVHADCVSDACPSGTCLSSRSCKQHFGGETCGAGEIDDPAHVHEDCCLSIQPGNKPYRLDKYLVTAGRMRAFIETVGPDVRSWAQANRALLPTYWSAAWDSSLPANEVDVVQLIGTGQGTNAYWTKPGEANGCYAKGQGSPTYWHAPDVLSQYANDERAWTQDELDTKTLNCTPRALFVAFCAWDGGRLPTWSEWAYAVRGDDTEKVHPFPWGADTDIYSYASYDHNYGWPPARVGMPLANDGLPVDRAFNVAAPGRFPAGAGPFGHQDLLGLVETFVSGDSTGKNLSQGGIRQYSFQEAYYGVEAYGTSKSWSSYISHMAVGARCARDLAE
ncbi:MAG: SUMF1/EgtB/PvdO family nonheme iron enzyme [Polyangiaceae bacterium]|nr:SUMF1/EgtB/PvdO family nonheme iron enzyme [Polyangiaceae bacterium]